ncbi:APC family permease [Arthrobacter sp. H14]|uniref:APC family permease n=1 Tax=Arthrobacter sp. H14 TaxID=1312959 RepID=UPI0004795AFE|nr:APC family permease [Arthrobacter sp. H14]
MSGSAGLQRQLGGFDATTVGIGSMIGAGVFVVFAPAAAAAGSWLPLAVAIAGFVAYCNASASAQLARIYPTSGGTYVYGRKRLGPWAGFIAGWSFVTGKAASCAAMAFTFGLYAFPGYETAAGIAAVVLLTTVNLLGITRTAMASRIIVSLVVAILAFLLVVAFSTSPAPAAEAPDLASPLGVLQAAAVLFFAFAGYARIATMGEEVREPERNIPRAILASLAVVLILYMLLALGLLEALGAETLAETEAPLLALAQDIGDSVGTGAVTVAAALASLGALLALIAGVGRTSLAMARGGDLPRPLARISSRFQVPFIADLTVAAVVILLLLTTDVLTVVGFSSFGVLIYYAIANMSAFTLEERPWYWPKVLNAVGFIGCLLLAFTLPLLSVLTMLAVLLAGLAGRAAVQYSGDRENR